MSWIRNVVMLALATLILSVGSVSAKTITIKVGLIDPPGHLDTIATEKFAEIVNNKSNGQVKVEVYPASQLGFAMDMLSGMGLGTIEMFVGATTWLGAFETDYWISGCLYVFNDQEHARMVHQGPMFDKLAETMRTKHGIRILGQEWDRGARNFISTKPLNTVDDLKGLKVRVPEQKSWIANFKLAGANPTPIALAETFTGLQQGIVEATEQASNWLFFNKYHTIANNLVLSNHNYEETGVMISEIFYQSLPADVQKLLVDAVDEVTVWRNEALADDIAKAEAEMKAAGTNIIEVDKAAWQKHFRANFPTLVKEVGYSDELAEYIMGEWK